MTINRTNYEAYMLDYLEGNLDPLLTAELMAFLAENPEFDHCLTDYDPVALQDNHTYTYKSLLKRDFSAIPSITAENFDEFCIAACEGLLSKTDIVRLQDYLHIHPEKQKDFDTYGRIRLQADTSIRYPGKAVLKKARPLPAVFRYIYYAAGIAAAIALFMVWPHNNQSVNNTPDAHSISSVSDTLPADTFASRVDISIPESAAGVNSLATAEITLPAAPDDQVVPADTATIQTAYSVLSFLDPIESQAIVHPVNPSSPVAYLQKSQSQPDRTGTSGSSEVFGNTFLASLIDRIDFWNAAQTALQGFNYLTEAKLSIDKTTDETGKTTSLLLSMENYTISGNKIK